ncbi:MAG: RNA polymerase sigma factor [Deltaproteobacteria bacterium]|nr:RNA polymerase sigma factor [Deltaproteobacteria bacterium]
MKHEITNQSRNPRTAGETLRPHLPQLRRMARWYAGDPDEADDLLQDTLLLALRFIDSYEEGTNLRAWLLRVMRNRHISLSRRRSLERRVLEREGAHALTAWSVGDMGRHAMEDGGGVDKDLSLSDPVALAMDELRPEFKDAVWLCDVEDLSYAEAAVRLACPMGTIMSRLHRGRRALRRRLGSRRELEAA